MRVYETAFDLCAVPGMLLVARIDGRSFTRTKKLEGMSVAEKNELLFQHGINFNDVPNWQKRGVGLYWETYSKPGFNPKTEQTMMAKRRRIKVDYELPMKDAYGEFVVNLLAEASEA